VKGKPMNLRTLALAAGLSSCSVAALANSGHVIQVHHGATCISFVTLEDANAICGVNNVFLANGTVNSVCMAALPWYGIGISTDPTQTALTVSQLPSFIAWGNAIEAAFHETQAVFGAEDVQVREGFSVTPAEAALLLGPSSELGFVTNTTPLSCVDIDAGGTRNIISVTNLNTPPGPNQ
jgi:hypothetical protein